MGGGGALVAEPILSATAAGVRQLFGTSPLEAPGEVWGAGVASRGRLSFVRYTDAGGWESMPDPVDPEGKAVPLTGSSIPELALAGRTTPSGGVATVVSTPSASPPQALAIRDPGGQFHVIPAPEEPLLHGNEELFSVSASKVRIAAVDEQGGRTGAYVVPVPKSGTTNGVMHYDGVGWAREPICSNLAPESCVPQTSSTFSVIAIDANGPGGTPWLLAKWPKVGEAGEGIVLMRREADGEWRRQTLGGELGALFASQKTEVAGVKVFVAAREKAQPLTVTTDGVWVDATIAVGSTSSPKSDATFYFDGDKGEVTGSWCDLPESVVPAAREKLCRAPLGSELPAEGRSFAWPPGPGEEFGKRAITGVGQGAMLVFEGAFARIPLDGNGGGRAGAALTSPETGWLGPSYRLTRAPAPSGLAPWPVPFRRPLSAVAPQPGAAVAALSSQALAVGAKGQVARYLPGLGWQPESLLTGSGLRATPNLRAVAWPQPGIAYAVGDEGAMWLWRASSGLWEPDPGAPPNLIRGNFTGIAFDPTDPGRGYAVGKQGLLLRYDRRWTQEALPAGVNPEINITSIAFAGHEALATYTIPVARPERLPTFTGGLLVNDGSGWRIEGEAPKVLEGAEGTEGVSPRRVAGLPDGGAVVVGSAGGVIEREAAGAPWQVATGGPVGFPVAASAIREGGQVRAVLSVEGNPLGVSTASREQGSDEPQAKSQPASGQAPLLTSAYPLPKNGFVVRQTASGWRDEQRESFPVQSQNPGQSAYDLPRIPDAILGLLVSPDGAHGWAVGGNTGEIAAGSQFGPYLREGLQTGGVMRYGTDAAPPENASVAAVSAPSKQATFAVGGNAACIGPCADLAGTGIGPDVWLRTAIGFAATIQSPKLRGFLYTGTSVAPGAGSLGRAAFGEEEAAYARRLGSAAGTLPVYPAPSETDVFQSSLASFAGKFSGYGQPLGEAPAAPGIVPLSSGDRSKGNYSYAFESTGSGGPVRVLVLDYSSAPLSTEKQCWLAQQLAEARQAKAPAIVVGNREVGGETSLRRLLVSGENEACKPVGPAGASAYFYKAEGNRLGSLSWGKATIPAFGTGSLGYTKIPNTERNEYVSPSGFLLASVNVEERNGSTNVAPVTVELIPSIGSLAIDAVDGTLLRRSQTALFEALARRPIAGISCSGNAAPSACENVSPDAYVQIPARCTNRASCASEIPPEYSFSSSRPDIADFVKVDPTSSNPRAVFLNKNGKTVLDPRSGLLCAYNSGTTVVTVQTGGLAYSTSVTVQKGSVQQPCGTVPRQDLVAPQPQVPAPVAPAPSHAPNFTSPPGTLPPPSAPATPPAPVPPPVITHPLPKPVPPTYFFAPQPTLTPVIAIVPPPPPPAVQTTPPSGTSPVTQPAFSPEPEEEEEAAFDIIHHAAAYRAPAPAPISLASSDSKEGGPSLAYGIPLLILFAALAGAGLTGSRRRTPGLAYATQSAQRRPRR